MNVKLEYVKEQRQHGDHLVDSGKIHLKENKTKIVDDISTMGKRINSLLESVSCSRIRCVKDIHYFHHFRN